VKWIRTSQIDLAALAGQTFSGRFGASVLFCSYSPLTGWHWIYPGGSEKIQEPQALLCDPEWAEKHPRHSPVLRSETPTKIKRSKVEQMLLNL
jgi:hypothetical protein